MCVFVSKLVHLLLTPVSHLDLEQSTLGLVAWLEKQEGQTAGLACRGSLAGMLDRLRDYCVTV